MKRPAALHLALGNANAQVRVIGRTGFDTGIGTLSYGACEALSRAFEVSMLPTEPARQSDQAILLPNGRRIPVARHGAPCKVSIFCDVLWNGVADRNYLLMPEDGLRIAWIAFDSDELPPTWVDILNHRFDILLVTSPHLMAVAENSGVEIPVGAMPIPLELGAALARPYRRPPGKRVRFLTVGAFHPRKGQEQVVEAFLDAFAGRHDVELLLHSNTAFGETFDRIAALLKRPGGHLVKLSHENLSHADKDRLIRSADVFVNCSRGEGYSVGPREALATGAALVLTHVGGHIDLAGPPGVFSLPATIEVPARYPEIDNAVFGSQRVPDTGDIASALAAADQFARSPAFTATVHDRCMAAAQWSFEALATSFASMLDAKLPLFRLPQPPHPCVILPPRVRDAVERVIGPRANGLGQVSRLVQLAHDGGFFSVFNAFVSHVVWEQREERCHAVLPDWDVGRMIADRGTATMTSFCYGQPGDGNLWCHLFEPPFGFSAAELNDPAVLYRRSARPQTVHNELREPQMTYVHAYKLYQSKNFARWRRQYHAVFARHIRLRASLADSIDQFAAAHFTGRFVIGAHVRHPSHTVEQPGAVIAHDDAYITRIRAILAERGLTHDTGSWVVFLATDQDRVVRRFTDEFGANAVFLTDVRRTREAEDQAFDRLSDEEKHGDGHQLQHLVAADRPSWSIKMAEEVIRDAWLMARCDVLLHVVSNVSTAVSYMNPDLVMEFCSAEIAIATGTEAA